MAIAKAMRRGVFEAIPAGTVGALEALGGERAKPVDEVLMFAEVSRCKWAPRYLHHDPDRRRHRSLA